MDRICPVFIFMDLHFISPVSNYFISPDSNYFQIEREEDSDKSEGNGFQVGKENHFKVNIGKPSDEKGNNNAGANPSFKVNIENRMKMSVENDQKSKNIGFNSNKVPHKDAFSDSLYTNGAKAVGNGLNDTQFSFGGEPTLMTKNIPSNYMNGKPSMNNGTTQNLQEGSSMNNNVLKANTANSGTDECKCAARFLSQHFVSIV